jgi:hypothetical protein
MTEHYLTGSGISGALQVAKEINDSMSVANYNAYVWWWVHDWSQESFSFGLIDANSNVKPAGYAMAQYSKFVRPGYSRYNSTYNPSTSVYVTAYGGSSHHVIVAINMGSIDAVRAEARAFLNALSRRPTGAHHRGSMPYLVATSAPLRRHWLAVAERHGRAVARALVADAGGALSLPEANVLGASLVAVFAVIIDEIGQTMTTDGDVSARIKTLRHEVESALDRMSNNFTLSSARRP